MIELTPTILYVETSLLIGSGVAVFALRRSLENIRERFSVASEYCRALEFATRKLNERIVTLEADNAKFVTKDAAQREQRRKAGRASAEKRSADTSAARIRTMEALSGIRLRPRSEVIAAADGVLINSDAGVAAKQEG